MRSLKDNDPAARAALMADLRNSCYGQLPSVGIFWYNPEEHALCGVRKKEMSPVWAEAAASDGLPFINYPELHRDVWNQLNLSGEYDPSSPAFEIHRRRAWYAELVEAPAETPQRWQDEG